MNHRPDALARNTAQPGDALTLLRSLPERCARLGFFDPQHRDNLDKLKYGNEGERQNAMDAVLRAGLQHPRTRRAA